MPTHYTMTFPYGITLAASTCTAHKEEKSIKHAYAMCMPGMLLIPVACFSGRLSTSSTFDLWLTNEHAVKWHHIHSCHVICGQWCNICVWSLVNCKFERWGCWQATWKAMVYLHMYYNVHVFVIVKLLSFQVTHPMQNIGLFPALLLVNRFAG